jgi:hypothetical protein
VGRSISWFAVGMWLVATLSAGGQPAALAPAIDNARVTVWDVTWEAPGRPRIEPPADLVVIALSPGPAAAAFLKKGTAPTGPAHGRSIVIALKDARVPPIANVSGYPNAFPRPGVTRLVDNDRVIVWDYRWTKGQPTPMHFHDKDVVVLYLENGSLRSTTPDGQQTVNDYTAGALRFNLRDRTHTEALIGGSQRAIITEFK